MTVKAMDKLSIPRLAGLLRVNCKIKFNADLILLFTKEKSCK